MPDIEYKFYLFLIVPKNEKHDSWHFVPRAQIKRKRAHKDYEYVIVLSKWWGGPQLELGTLNMIF